MALTSSIVIVNRFAANFMGINENTSCLRSTFLIAEPYDGKFSMLVASFLAILVARFRKFASVKVVNMHMIGASSS